MLKVFGLENHTYCIRHLRENFIWVDEKMSFKHDTSKDMLKDMFNVVAYVPSDGE